MKITIIGSGNVATHMASALKNAGHHIVQVYSRQEQHAALLAYHVRAEAISDLHNLNPETDLLIISVKDDAIPEIAAQLSPLEKLMVHTSGATELQTLLNYTPQAGVFYPLQTFSKIKEVNFSKVPMCIEGGNEQITQLLEQLAATISHEVYRVDSAQRKILHLAAVFACNFPNYLYSAAQQLLAQHELSFDLLRPLVLETAEKVQQQLPQDVQTGPAIRNDQQTMQAHLALLSGQAGLQALYEVLSQAIIKMGEGKHSFD